MKVWNGGPHSSLSFKFRGEGGSLYTTVVLAKRGSNDLLRLGGFPTADGPDSPSSAQRVTSFNSEMLYFSSKLLDCNGSGK